MWVEKNKKILFTGLFLFLCISYAKAQFIEDNELRSSISLDYDFTKRLSVSGTYYMQLEHKMSQYEESILSGEINYKIASWLEAGLEFRYYGFSNSRPKKEMRYALNFERDLSKKWEIKYRAMIEQEFVSFKKKYLKKNPIEYYFRNRIKLNYELSKKIDLYVFTEPYIELGSEKRIFSKLKSGTGIK